MGIQLGSYNFDEEYTSVVEKLEEVGGKESRSIKIQGMLCGFENVNAIENELDTIIETASSESANTQLLLRAGRRMWVRRVGFDRQIDEESVSGSFCLNLKSDTALEESTTEVNENWSVTQSGDTLQVTPGGNHIAYPVITVDANGNLIKAKISDGTNSLEYEGTVSNGDTLVIDGQTKKIYLNGEDVSWYCNGDFPVLDPAGTTLSYTDSILSSHLADITVTYRDTWW